MLGIGQPNDGATDRCRLAGSWLVRSGFRLDGWSDRAANLRELSEVRNAVAVSDDNYDGGSYNNDIDSNDYNGDEPTDHYNNQQHDNDDCRANDNNHGNANDDDNSRRHNHDN